MALAGRVETGRRGISDPAPARAMMLATDGGYVAAL